MRRLTSLRFALTVFIFCLLCFFRVMKTEAAVPHISLKIRAVIDNPEDVPAGARFNYMVTRVYELSRTGQGRNGNGVLLPYKYQDAVFSFTSDSRYDVGFPSIASAAHRENILIFHSANNTDRHISLTKIDYKKGLKSYRYTDGGRANPAINPFNWAEITGNDKAPEVTLHFRYNTDIGEINTESTPNPTYTKRIDYLGDGGHNPDTSVSGENDYRLYLTLNTQKKEDDKKRDIIFLLDLSGSMSKNYGTSSVTRMRQMQETVSQAIDSLTLNPENRISIVIFATTVETVIKNSNNASALKRVINSLPSKQKGMTGGTNYYSGLLKAGEEVKKALSGNETVVFFVTDGVPTAAQPAVNALGLTNQYPIGLIYGAYAAERFPKTDKFFSVFMGSSGGDTSTLQSVTQRIPVNKEKYTLQADSPEQLKNTFDRFVSKLGNSLYDVVIEDTLSEYVDYAHEAKVIAVSGNKTVVLRSGTDYNLSYDTASKKVSMKLLKNTTDDTKYILSFNVRVNDRAFEAYTENPNYPDVGEVDTDYEGNATSSGQAGYFSNKEAVLRYSYAGGKSASHTYKKPVVQAKVPQVPQIPIPAKLRIKASKLLTGKELAAGMFTFEIQDENKRTLASAVNDADGNIEFDTIGIGKSGESIYNIVEVKPDVAEPGMTYDETVFKVKIKAEWKKSELTVTKVEYISGKPVFNNKYEPKPVTVNLNANKILKDSPIPLKANEYEFGLYQLNSGSSALIDKAKNAGDGKISFNPITLTKAGSYEYLLREIVPDTPNSHIIYDQSTVKITVEVRDNNAALVADVKYSKEPVFTNIFKYKEVEALIQVQKILTGMKLVDNMFEFEILGTDSKQIEKAGNNALGEVGFTKLKFDKPGTFTYKIREIIPEEESQFFDKKYMNFDTKEITVNVSVGDSDGNGDLEADITYSETPIFYNSYKVRGSIK